jgi:hypothetical protein
MTDFLTIWGIVWALTASQLFFFFALSFHFMVFWVVVACCQFG